ncbi:hypothetical protein HNQ02_002193 [Flavobacterium sp. 7E]|uniref:RagB/SusD family nutrient uptake outer membrane protein n=1 Tax=Flavobacterium sp. 7E TaxID=2735898 RepID=UPI00157015F7|nr:RagB/SusD family nutrient uptake outer membrane protein [Flavobacterium sp. 7E]NRS89267.1 hypothetical protein [Flavobacterium sp. 7E]
MKYIYKLLIVFALTISVSCSLEQEPTTFLSDNNFYNTPAEMESAVLHAYEVMTYLDYTTTYMNIATTAAEETIPKEGEGLNIDQFDRFQVDNRNQNLEFFFRLSYIGLNRANTVIEKSRVATFNEELKNRYLGEALFLRAWHHFMLTKLFGEIPLKVSAVDEISEVFGAKNAPLEDVYALLIKDLNEAISLLSVKRDGGRADKVAAQALLSKVYLTMASAKNYSSPGFNWVSDANTYYTLASQLASEVVNNQSVYTFDTNLLNIYRVDTPDTYNGPEHIFFIAQDRNGLQEGEYSKLSKYFIPADTPATSFTADGTKLHIGYNVHVAEIPFLNSFDIKDKRRNDLVIDELFDESGASVWTPAGGQSQPFTRKYIDPLFIGDNTSTHPYLLRFSDILLVYAEAQGPTAAGYNAINKIRQRAGLLDLTPGLSVPEFRERVIKERSFELAFEANRLYDLRRTNKVESVLNGIYGKSLGSGLYFYPIPAIEGELNK